MEFKVVLNVDGEDIEMLVLFVGATVNVDFHKNGESIKKYENLPVEILSQLSKQEETPLVVDLTTENENVGEEDDEYYGGFFDGLGDIDQLLAEAGEDIVCDELATRLRPICRRNIDKIEDVSSNLINAFTEPEYGSALELLKVGLGGITSLSETFIKDLGGEATSVPGSDLLYGRFGRRRNRKDRY